MSTKGVNCNMTISHEHQLLILKDILQNQQSDCCGTVSECEQLERLIKSLLTNDNITDETKHVLSDVYQYSQAGQYSSDLQEHISNHQDQLSQWISGMDSLP